MIIYVIVFHLIRIRGLRVNSTLNQGPGPSVLLGLVFSVVKFDLFQFQILFFNIYDFS